MKSVIRYSIFFVDTCSLMHPMANKFFGTVLASMLISENTKIYMPYKVIEELNRLLGNKQKQIAAAARRGIRIVKSYMHQNLIDIRHSPSDPFTDCVFLHVFSKFRVKHDLTLLTQDKKLAMDIVELNGQRSVQSYKKIRVFRLGRTGFATEWKFDQEFQGRNYKSYSNATKPLTHSRPNTKKFALVSQLANVSDKTLSVSRVPSLNDSVIGRKQGTIKLVEKLGQGGEGAIYRTDRGNVCKIYFRDKLTESKRAKLELMTSRDLKIKGICWPQYLVYNRDGQFVGYTMSEAKGMPLQKAMFIKPILAKNFPGWTRVHIVQLARTILDKFEALHRLNIVVGDINPLNIQVCSPEDVYFVDTDSYQLEGLPCPVGTINFTPPEIQGQNFNSLLRTIEHEKFAIATLLFMILLPGKPPYSHQGGGDPGKNIKEQEFSYPFGGQSNKKAPEGPWRYMWSHLPYITKQAFYECFNDGKRPSIVEWKSILNKYLYSLEKGHVGDAIYPTHLKQVSDYAKKAFDVDVAQQCISVCPKCNKNFLSSKEFIDKHISSGGVLCPDCWKVRKQVSLTHKDSVCEESSLGTTYICKDCSKTFVFTNGEKKHYAIKGLVSPKRCKACRAVKKSRSKTATVKPRPKPRIPVGYIPAKRTQANSNSSVGFLGILQRMIGI